MMPRTRLIYDKILHYKIHVRALFRMLLMLDKTRVIILEKKISRKNFLPQNACIVHLL